MRIRLRYKVFFIILLANALVASAMVLINNRAFENGFDAYLEQVQSRRLAPLLSTLAERYAEQGNWQWVQGEPGRWHRLMRDVTPGRMPHEQRSVPVLLLDAEGNRVFGDARLAPRSDWFPIEHQGEVVGRLGVPRAQRFGSELDALFADQQRRQMRWVGLISLVVAAALAIPFASRLLQPIARLKSAFDGLAQGELTADGKPRTLNVQGQDELADLARDFNSLAETLHRNQQARQRWIVDIAHELRTPVAVLKAEIEALQDGVRAPTPEALGSLFQEVQRLGHLVGDLHDLSLSDAGTLAYHKSEVDLASLLVSVYAANEGALARKHLQWSLKAPPQGITLEGDAHRLLQLFSNLMQNSLRYTDGTVELPGQVQVEVAATSQQVRIRWSDSAPGVPADALPHLFERLYRVDASRSRATGGSGLGLSIVRAIAQAHGGEASAEPSALGGLTITVTLNLAPGGSSSL
jgi:two-component system sensor histidine kinase BaeS